METVTYKDFFSHVDSFLDYRKVVYESSEQTLKTNLKDIELFQNYLQMKDRKTIDGPTVMDYQFYLKNERNNCGGSINRKIFTLRSYSNYLNLQNVANADSLPFYDVLKIRNGYRNRPNSLPKDKVKIFFSAIEQTTFLGIRDYAVYALMYMVGLRVGEVFSLTLESIDLKNKTIRILGKGNKIRVSHINSELFLVLSQWLAVRPKFLNYDKCHALFISKKGNPLAIRTMEDNFNKILDIAKIDTHFNVTCHTLRHSFASHLNDEETDILVIQSLMGHASTRSTQAYIHPSMERIKEALEKLPGVLFMNKLIRSGKNNFMFQGKHNMAN